jgi:streptogramin lyase
VHGVAWLGAISFFGSGWYVMNHDYLKHRTLLVEQGRWEVKAPLKQPLGIAYLDGKIYVADYQGQSVGELDTATGTYRLVQPSSAEGPLTFARPGDVKVGPDGLLYVLNNGEGHHALYAMKPDGEVVRQVALEGKSPVATGLSFGPDGSIYVADMVGGWVIAYGAVGGDPQGAWRGVGRGFNNVAGVTVAEDGTVYAGELGFERVHQRDRAGRSSRAYDVKCQPWYMAINGDWLDLSCHTGVVSINRGTGTVQRSAVAHDRPPPANPTGLAYGPDSTLFVLDRSTVIAYKVHH